jgi:N-acetylglucosamine-6-phosphate deacetylase
VRGAKFAPSYALQRSFASFISACSRDGIRRLDDGTLAGSASTLDRGVRAMVSQGATLAEALTMATAVPARLLGTAGNAIGRIAPGRSADLVLWDGDMQVQATFVGGIKRPFWNCCEAVAAVRSQEVQSVIFFPPRR